MDKERSKAMIRRDEGSKYNAYRDSLGIWTIGIGHNMEADPRFAPPYSSYKLTLIEIQTLFDEDFAETLRALRLPKYKRIYEAQDEARQAVMENMMFNLGERKFAQFKKFLAAMEKKDYIKAACEMQDSRWWHQVGERALRLQKIVLNGKDCSEWKGR